MSKAKSKPAPAAQKTKILIATNELTGGDVVVRTGEELTEEKAKAIGLDADAITDLVARGHLAEVDARKTETAAGDADLAAAIERAESVEAEVATLTAKVAQLEKDLEAATTPPKA